MTKILAPFGSPVEERPAVPSEEERIAERARRREEKDARRGARSTVDGQGGVEGVQEVKQREVGRGQARVESGVRGEKVKVGSEMGMGGFGVE